MFLLAAHPVGSYYWSSDPTSPATLFGGKWEQVKDRFILAAGDTYKAGGSGGAASATSDGHIMTANEMPPGAVLAIKNASKAARTTSGFANMGNLQHAPDTWVSSSIGYATYFQDTLVTDDSFQNGGHGAQAISQYGKPHTHTVATMPPYTVAYCWRRTA